MEKAGSFFKTKRGANRDESIEEEDIKKFAHKSELMKNIRSGRNMYLSKKKSEVRLILTIPTERKPSIPPLIDPPTPLPTPRTEPVPSVQSSRT